MLNKRLIILISAIAGIIIITILALWLVFRAPAETPASPEKEISPENTFTPITPPPEGVSIIFKLSSVAAVSPAISGDKILYYSKLNGNVLETTSEGTTTITKTNIAIPGLMTTLWSQDKSQAINIYKENETVKKVLFEFDSQKATLLDSRIKWIAFAPKENKIAYQFIDSASGANNIAISGSNGLNWKNIFSVRTDDVRVYWPKDTLVAFATSPSGLAKGALFTKTTDNQSSGLTKIIDNANGLTVKYSPDGNALIYSYTDQYGHNPALYLQKSGGTAENLNIATLSDKCAFSKNNNIYCAVPKIIRGSLVLPDDYYKNTADFSDLFFKIDVSANKSSLIFNPEGFGYDFNAGDMIVSDDENYLIFVNKKDGLLYSIKI